MKSEQARPRIANLFTESGQMIPQPVSVFTASETAQIAKAYANSKSIYKRAMSLAVARGLESRKSDHALYLANKAIKQVQAFENLFEEWQK